MARRRMFSLDVVNRGAFLRLPATARCLYYDLGMRADDDGFAEGFSVLRVTGASEDDLQKLEDKGFVRIVNDDLLVWIEDWMRNNLIRKERYTPSVYHDLLSTLVDELSPTCHPSVTQADDRPTPACHPSSPKTSAAGGQLASTGKDSVRADTESVTDSENEKKSVTWNDNPEGTPARIGADGHWRNSQTARKATAQQVVDALEAKGIEATNNRNRLFDMVDGAMKLGMPPDEILECHEGPGGRYFTVNLSKASAKYGELEL